MALLGQKFVADVAAAKNFDPIPDGWYDATIVAAELKESKNGGHYLNVRYDIIGPSHEGRVVFGIIVISGSEKAMEIGHQQLSEIMLAVGLKEIEDSDELLSKKVKIKVGTKPPENGYEAKNVIKRWMPISSANTAAPTTTIQTDDVQQDDIPF